MNNEYDKRGKRRKTVVLMILFVFTVFLLIYQLYSNAQREKQKKHRVMQVMEAAAQKSQLSDRIIAQPKVVGPTTVEEIATLKEKQAAVVLFEENLSAITDAAQKIFLQQENCLKDWLVGKKKTTVAYEMTKLAEEECQKVREAILLLALPQGLPDTVEKSLMETKQYMVMAYSNRRDALGDLLKFTVERKQGYLDQFNSGMRTYRSFLSSATLNIMEIKQQMGIMFSEKVMLKKAEEERSYKVEAIAYSKRNPFVFMGGEIFHLNNYVREGKIIAIFPDRVILKFKDTEEEYKLGEVIK